MVIASGSILLVIFPVLKEVDRFDHLYDLLQKDGFRGVYQARTGEACDGCAIFWKKEHFDLLHQENIVFQRFGLRNNVAQLCVLKMNQDKSNSRTDTQASQFDYLLRRPMNYHKNGATFLLYLLGTLIACHRPLMYRWSDEELRLASGTEGITHLRHPFKLCSAYLGVHGSCRTRDNYGEPLATSYHSKFMGTVDYIWHTEDLVPVGVLDTLPIDVLKKTGGLPSKNWGSDHLALVCELAFADNGNGT